LLPVSADVIIVREMWSLVLAMFLGAGVAASQPAAPPSQPAGSDTAEYYFLIGRYLEGAGRIDEAIAAHKRAIELEPGSAELRAELAALYARQDNAIDAIQTAEAALERDPANHEANRILGSVYAAFAERRLPLRQGDDPSTYAAKAIAYLEKIESDGLDVGVELALARLYIQTGAFVKAIPLLERVVDEQPGFVEGAFLLSTAQENAGQTNQAIDTLKGVLQQNPDSFRAQVRLAELYERQQRWHEAADAYGRAQGLNPRATMLTGRRAVALLSAGRAVEARDLVQGALGADRAAAPDPILLYLLAESQRALKELDAAQATVQKLLAASPDDTRGLHVLSLIQQDKGDLKGAEKTLRDLIGRDPLDANALNTLGYMLAERGERLSEAVELVQRALKIEPGNPSYLDSLGWAYFQQGRIDLADTPLTEAAAKLSTNSVVQDHLGDLRFKQQRYGDAADAWVRALAGDGQSIDKSKIEKKIRDARGRM
jgi:tetratricopeptide (TPR) repeat protein